MLITKTYCLRSKYIRKPALINCAKRMHTRRMVSIQLIQRIVAKTLMQIFYVLQRCIDKTHIMFIFGIVFFFSPLEPCTLESGKVDDSLNKSAASIVCGNEQLCKSFF